LPDGIFVNQKSQFVKILESFAMVDVVIFYGFCSILPTYVHLMYTFYGHLVYFMPVWHIFQRLGMLYQVKSGNPVDCEVESD
jgi:hypothetical protein